jgi:hypothetical protein
MTTSESEAISLLSDKLALIKSSALIHEEEHVRGAMDETELNSIRLDVATELELVTRVISLLQEGVVNKDVVEYFDISCSELIHQSLFFTSEGLSRDSNMHDLSVRWMLALIRLQRIIEEK